MGSLVDPAVASVDQVHLDLMGLYDVVLLAIDPVSVSNMNLVAVKFVGLCNMARPDEHRGNID